MNPISMLLGLAPWFVFSLTAERVGDDHVTYAAFAACALAFVITAVSAFRGHGWKVLDVAGVVLFGLIGVVGLLGSHQVDEVLMFFGRGGSAFILAAVMAISAYTVPFTEQYAKETVDPALWHSPIFREKNRRISLMWAAVVFGMACAHVLAGVLAANAAPGTNPGNILLNWVAPIVLTIIAIKQTRKMAEAPARTTPAAVS